MIKLKEAVPGQQVQPAQQNKFEPAAKQPVKAQTSTTARNPAKAFAPTAKKQPVKQVEPEQPVQPSQQDTQLGDVAKIQNQIFTIKIRLNQLALNTTIKKFQTTLQSFKSKITRNTTDKSIVQTYLSPLLGDIESFKGNLESLEVELKKLDAMTKAEEQ